MVMLVHSAVTNVNILIIKNVLVNVEININIHEHSTSIIHVN